MNYWVVIVGIVLHIPCLFSAERRVEVSSLRKLAVLATYRQVRLKAAVHNYPAIKQLFSRLPQDCALPLGWCVLLRRNRLTCYSKCKVAKLLLKRRDIDPDDRANLIELRTYYKEIQPKAGFFRRVANLALRNRPEHIVCEAEHNLQVRTWFRIAMDQEKYGLVQAVLDYTTTQLRVSAFLHKATTYNDERLVRMLLKSKKFNVNAQGFNGNTALHLVQSVEVAQLLLDAGAKDDIRNEHGRTPKQKAPAIFERLGML